MSKLKKILTTAISATTAMVLFVPMAFAEGITEADATVIKWKAMAAALCISIAAFGGALGQGRAAAAALEGVARNPGSRGDVFVPFILGLALIESLVIYALLIAFQLVP